MEEAVVLGVHSPLAGVITRPFAALAQDQPAVILLNSGTTHRVGPNRLSVRAARQLAGRGFLVLRFDLSGIGDSARRRDNRPFAESVLLETREAMDFLAQRHGIGQFILSGICSGGATAFVSARRDPRVVGALMINAQGHFHADQPQGLEAVRRKALTRHSWRIALRSSFAGKNWRKLLTGRLGIRRAMSMMLRWPGRRLSVRADSESPLGPAPDPRRDIAELVCRGVRLLHVYAEGDEGLDYFRVMLGRRSKDVSENGDIQLRVLQGVNHTFTQRWSQDLLIELIDEWMAEFLSEPTRPCGRDRHVLSE